MNPHIAKLISYIISEVKRRGGYVTKTKLLKLLYLFDVAYFRKHRQTFTGFDWKFLLFGPWTNEYDPLLQDLEKGEVISIARRDQTEFYSTQRRVESEEFIERVADELLLRRVLDDWAEEQTNRILDFVYFNTEPMIHGARFEKLDFSTIPEERPPEYKRTASGKSKKELRALREKLLANSTTRSAPFQPKKTAIKIDYDDVFFEGMRAFEEAD